MGQHYQPQDIWVEPGEHIEKSRSKSQKQLGAAGPLFFPLAEMPKPRICVCDLSTGECPQVNATPHTEAPVAPRCRNSLHTHFPHPIKYHDIYGLKDFKYHHV